MPVVFQDRCGYEPTSYRLLPFRFMRFSPSEVILVNEVGEYVFLQDRTFQKFVHHKLSVADPEFFDLQAKHFLWDKASIAPISLLATKYRTKKSFLEGFANLHLFIVTLRCEHSCVYCQVSRVSPDKSRYDMTRETARRSVNLMLRSPSRRLKVEFQGGEPLLNLPTMREVVDRTEAEKGDRIVQYVLATNLALLTTEALTFLREHHMLVSTSLDGPKWIHDQHRPRPEGDSYARTIQGIRKAREKLGEDQVSALMTTTKTSLRYPREIIDEYVAQGFQSIFLRPISPYGFAKRFRPASNYETSEFLEFYRIGLDHIIQLNRTGTALVEVYAQLLLTRILTPFATGYVDLQSPGGIGAVAYNYDGRVYPSDEARMLAAMGDDRFCLGNVHNHSYEELFAGAVFRGLVQAGVAESLPGCADCAFVPYCGADPVFHYATQGDPVGFRPTSGFCSRNMTIIRHLITLLREGDDFTKRLLTSWATGIAL
jgi:uncharacterized protein